MASDAAATPAEIGFVTTSGAWLRQRDSARQSAVADRVVGTFPIVLLDSCSGFIWPLPGNAWIVGELLHPIAQLRHMHTQILRGLRIGHTAIPDRSHRLKLELTCKLSASP